MEDYGFGEDAMRGADTIGEDEFLDIAQRLEGVTVSTRIDEDGLLVSSEDEGVAMAVVMASDEPTALITGDDAELAGSAVYVYATGRGWLRYDHPPGVAEVGILGGAGLFGER